MCAIVGNLHAQIIHPRYLLVCNSWIYNSNSNIETMVNELIRREKNNSNACFVHRHFSPDKFDSIDYGSDCRSEKYQVMLGLERMHRDGVPLLRRNMLPRSHQAESDI